MVKRKYILLKSKIRQDNGLRSILKNISWLFFDKVIRIGLGFILTAWTARYLGAEIFGIWNYAIAFVALFSVFSTLGLDNIVVREIVKNENSKNEILGAAFLLKLSGGILALVLSLITIAVVKPGNDSLLLIVGIIALSFIFQSFDVIDYHYQSELRSKLVVVARNAAFLISAIIKVVLLLSKASLVYFVSTGLFEIAATSILLIWMYHKKSGSLLQWTIQWTTVKKLIKDSFPLIFASLVILIYMRTDQIMLGNMVGDSEVGVFSAAVRLSEAWYFIPLIITNSLLPSIIAAKDSDSREYLNRLQKSFDFMALLGVLTALVVSAFAYYIIEVVFGSEYSKAAPILVIHTWTSVFVFIGFASGNWFIVENLQKLVFYRTLSGAVVNVALNYAIIPVYGGIGAAIATLVSQFVASYFFNLFTKRTYPVFKMQSLALFKVTGIYFLFQGIRGAFRKSA